jgi:predicted DNA-binding transcriptional regulator YafY
MPSTVSNEDRILALLNDGGQPTIDELATELDLTTRHVRRLIALLREQEIPVQESRDGRSKRYFLLPEDQRRSTATIDLTEEEILALTVAASAARAALASTPLGDPINRAFGELLKKLGAEVRSFDSESQGVHWHFGDTPHVEIDPAIFKAIAAAIDECRVVGIDYLTASTGEFSRERPVDPYAMAVRGGSWMLVGYCHKRKKVIDFSLAGISGVLLTEKFFVRKASFSIDKHFAGRFKALSGAGTYHVRLQVEPRKAPYFQRKRYNASQTIDEQLPDGSLIVSFDVTGLEEIRSFIQSWGVGVIALDPPELVETICDELDQLKARYRESAVRSR